MPWPLPHHRIAALEEHIVGCRTDHESSTEVHLADQKLHPGSNSEAKKIRLVSALKKQIFFFFPHFLKHFMILTLKGIVVSEKAHWS